MQFTKVQKRIINSKPNGHTLIKGLKGTGKTTAAVSKMSSLLNSYCNFKDDRVLIVTYDEEASKNVSSIYENIIKGKYLQSSFFDEDNSSKLEINTIRNIISHYFSEYKNVQKNSIDIASDIECESELREAINTLADKYKKLKLINTKNIDFIKDEIAWIKSCNYLSLEEYQTSNRGKRNSNTNKTLRKNSKQRQAIYDVLLEYNNNLNKLNKIDIQDMSILALKEASKNKNKRYTHILIDDTQNLTKVQLEFLKYLYNEKSYSSITFILESEENACKEAWISNTKGRTFSSLGYDMKGKSISLKINHTEEFKIDSKGKEIFNSNKVKLDSIKGRSIKDKTLKRTNENFEVLEGVNSYNLIEEDLITLSLRNTENESIISEVKSGQNYNKSKNIEVKEADDTQVMSNINTKNTNYNSLTLETIQYIDLKRNLSHMFIKDAASIGEIYIEDGGIEEKVEDVIEIPVFNEIAAGNPILMNDAVEDNYYLPKDWIRKSKDVFILKIKGDSMVKKNINDGDYVVVNKQNTANIGDIVAVDIDGEATLKTFKTKYGRISLTPENDSYEPIIIEEQQFYILGVAIGVVKNQM